MKLNKTLSIILVAVVPAVSLGADPETAAAEKERVPTRLVTGDLDSYLSGIRAKLAINSKDRGPFGLFQQPGKEPEQPLLDTFKRPKKKAEIPLQTMVNALPVAVVMPAEGMFMVWSRLVHVGEIVPLMAGGRTVRAIVESVGPNQIVFRDLANSKRATKVLALLSPNGVELDQGEGIRTPGVVPDGGTDEIPFELDLGLPPEARDE